MTSNHANAIFQWQANLLFHKTKVRPVPKDYPIPLIPIYTKEIYFYKNKTNLWNIYTINMKNNLTLKTIIPNE